MTIDETAGSGGDLLPWMFRKFKLGQISGRYLGRARRRARRPHADGRRDDHGAKPGDLDAEEGWVVENESVPPDVEWS